VAGVRSMLDRVRRLEAARAMVSPIQRWFGSVESFEADVRAGMDAGALDRRDMTDVLACVQRWHRDGLWAT
jgi:chromosome condensin MukBEF MukE localization factor